MCNTWSIDEHRIWVKMMKEGKNFESISEAVKTKSEFLCRRRCINVVHYGRNSTRSAKYEIDDEIIKVCKPFY